MKRSIYRRKSEILQQLMQNAGISTVSELSKIANVPELQIIKLQYGMILKLPLEFTINMASALQISVDEFVQKFTFSAISLNQAEVQEQQSREALASLEQKYQDLQEQFQKQRDSLASLETLQQEYQRLQKQLEEQSTLLNQEFQQESLQILESWLLQWPTAIAIVQKNPQLPAERILSLVKPVEKLIQKWGIEKIAAVGDEVSYNPRQHELIKGTAEIGDLVKVRYVGYQKGDRLLYRAKVSAIAQ